MSDIEEVTVDLATMAMQLEKVNANWNGLNPDLMSPEAVLSGAVTAMQLSKAVDILTTKIVGLATQKLAVTLNQALLEDKAGHDARASITRFAISAPETASTSLYWGLMAIYNASRKRGGFFQDEDNE